MAEQNPHRGDGGENNNDSQHHRSQISLRLGSPTAAVSSAAAAAASNNEQVPPPPARSQLNIPPFGHSSQAMLRQQAHSSLSSSSSSVVHPPTSVASYRRPPYGRNRSNNEFNNSASNPVVGSLASLSVAEDDGPEYEAESTNRQAEEEITSSGWSDVGPTGGIPPSPRSLHSAALLNGVMYIFGGYDGSARVNSFHAYSFAEKRWSPVLPSANSGPPPSPRDRHASVAFANSFYVHGGFDGTSRDDRLFAFDFSVMAWREVTAQAGRPPSARHSHSAVVHGNSMFVFGGYSGSYMSDLHEFDFMLSRWSAVPAAGRRPRARYRATCTVHKNWMILYGGHDGTRHLSDTFLFDFDTKTWSSLVTEGTPPIPRDSHVSVVHGNSMFVFGGSSGSAMNDLQELQLPSNNSTTGGDLIARWRPINASRSADQPKHRFCHVACVYNDSMYIHGGYDGSERLSSFIRFDFAIHDLSFEVPPSTIINDFRSLVNNDALSDVTFIVEGRSVYAHKLMLMRCSYFEALFLGQMRESSMDTIRIEQVRYDIFLSILEYLYTDRLVINFNNAMELFEAADLFCIHRLKTMCEKRMLQSITTENAAGIFHAADMHSAVALRQKTKKYILSHFEDVSKSSSFEEMGRRNIDLVFELLQSR